MFLLFHSNEYNYMKASCISMSIVRYYYYIYVAVQHTYQITITHY